MKKIKIGGTELQGSRIALGCMRINNIEKITAVEVIDTAFDNGIDFFDHADIYGGGECESIFAEALKQSSVTRDKIILQTKCGIRKGSFDFSKEHIIASVEGSLKRLKTDYIDVLALHRPDILVEPEEVAAAFDELEKSGKVRYFGVSNQKPMQIELLKKSVKQRLVVNQLQFGIMATGMINQGVHVNMNDAASFDHDGSVLDYSRLQDMTIQAWSPYQYGYFEGVFLGNEKFPEVNQAIDKLAEKYQVSNTAIATAWILRHPANMQTIVGTMNLSRIADVVKADGVNLSREEWYSIYLAAGNILP